MVDCLGADPAFHVGQATDDDAAAGLAPAVAAWPLGQPAVSEGGQVL